MKRTIFLIIPILAAFFLGIIMTGFYPVAIVDSSPIFFRKWRKAEEAARRFFAVQAHISRSKPIDFSKSENADLLLSVKRDTLTFLIEDKVISQEGKKRFENFEKKARLKVAEALQSKNVLRSQGALVYGLKEEDFVELILLPQARQDLFRESLDGKNLEEQIREIKKGKRVKLYFVPFSWNGENVR